MELGFALSLLQCDVLVEEYEDVIEDWYRHHQKEDLSQFLCADHVLKGKDTSEFDFGRCNGELTFQWGQTECLSIGVTRVREE